MNKDIKNINDNINNYKLNNNNKIKFYHKYDEYINLIKKFGYLSNNNKINDLEVCININNFNINNMLFYIKK